MSPRRTLAGLAAAVVLAAAGVAPAGAIVRPVAPAGADRAQQSAFDVRARTRAVLERRGVESLRRASADTRSARAGLRRRLGREALLDVDALTGTPRTFARLDGALAGPAQGSARGVAWRFARSRAAALGLREADLDGFGAPEVRTSASGITTVRWRQLAAGIPLYDNGLRVNLGRGNRVLSVQGAPVPDLSVGSAVPRLSAEDALRALMDDVGDRRPVVVDSRSPDVRRTTRFSTGDRARLVLFHAAGGTRLAWSVTYDATPAAWYEAVVDASSGRVLRRTNLTKHAQVFDNYPGAPQGGTQRTVAMAPGATLTGPFAHTYLDLNDNEQPDAGEEVAPGDYAFQAFAPADAFCSPAALCSWDPADRDSWEANKEQAAVQAHYYVSRFAEHLKTGAVAFVDGNLEGEDAVEVHVDDGATTGAGGGPDENHVNNANMATPPDGSAPRMQMFLFEPGPFRAINGADSADIVYHEYAHGLSSRLVVNEEGLAALSSPQAGAMGEGWSDWYAKDFLAREGYEIDGAGDGDVDLGIYTDGIPHTIRSEGLDCPVGGDAVACPGGRDGDGDGEPDSGTGGYTYGDFGSIFFAPEVHFDGEIWGQALWDLRLALVAQEGSQAAGSDLAEQLITDGMRLSPVEPSMLDMRNAILQADEGANGGANRDLIWGVFAERGMGYFAGAVDGGDVAPVESFAPPPAADGPKGTIAGTVTDATSGLPVAGQRVGIGGHSTDPDFGERFEATSGADGTYSIGSVPAGTYPKLAFFPAAGYDRIVHEQVAVAPGATAVRDFAIRRNWASASGGAGIGSNDDESDFLGCGHDSLIDQSLTSGWSPYQAGAPAAEGNPHPGEPPAATIVLPRAIDITAFAMDPSHTCGDDPSATTRLYRVETSTTASGGSFAVAREGAFAPGDAGRLNLVQPTANATGVRRVRLTLLEPMSEGAGEAGALFVDFTELEVFGGPPNVLPSGTLAASPSSAAPDQAVTLTASFTDPDSRITGYDWDFDANGTVDRSTAGAQTGFAYAAPGSYAAKVFAKDFRGGSGTASRTVEVVGAAAPGPGPEPGPGPAPAPSPGPGPGPGVNALAPSLRLPVSGRRSRARFRVACDSRCTGRARLTVDRRTARRLRLGGRRTVGTALVRLTAAGQKRITVTLSRRLRRAMARARVRRITARLAVTVVDAEGQEETSRRTLRIRR